MSKIIFLGTDLHGKPTELAAKLVLSLRKSFPDSHLLSLEHRKQIISQEKCTVISTFSNKIVKRIYQGIKLFIELKKLRKEGYDTIVSVWTAWGAYHRKLFTWMKTKGFKIVFTVINNTNDEKRMNYDVLGLADIIVVQSQRAYEKIKRILPKSKVVLIYPGVNLEIFGPSKKKYDLIIPSVPYKLNDFKSRGIDVVLKILRDYKLSATIIFRSKESYDYVKGLDIDNVELFNKALNDEELARIMSQCKVMPLYYFDSPETPLSAIEGLACGCNIVCSKNMGLGEILDDKKSGAVVQDEKTLREKIIEFIEEGKPLSSRKLAEKYFDQRDMLSKYKKILNT